MKSTQFLETLKQIYPITRNEIDKLLGLGDIGKSITALTVKLCQGPSDRNVHLVHLEEGKNVILRRVLEGSERILEDEVVFTTLASLHNHGYSIDGSIYVDLEDKDVKDESKPEQEDGPDPVGNSEEVNEPEQPDVAKIERAAAEIISAIQEDLEAAKAVAEATGAPVITAVQKPKRKHGKSRFKKKKLLESQQLNGLEPNGEVNVPSTEEVAEDGKEEV